MKLILEKSDKMETLIAGIDYICAGNLPPAIVVNGKSVWNKIKATWFLWTGRGYKKPTYKPSEITVEFEGDDDEDYGTYFKRNARFIGTAKETKNPKRTQTQVKFD